MIGGVSLLIVGLFLLLAAKRKRAEAPEVGVPVRVPSTPTALQLTGKSGKKWLVSHVRSTNRGAEVNDLWIGPGQYIGIDTFQPVIQYASCPGLTGQTFVNVLVQKYPAAATQAFADAMSDFDVAEQYAGGLIPLSAFGV